MARSASSDVDAFFKAWNTRDEGEREKELKSCLTETAEFSMDSEEVAKKGWMAVSAHIAGWQEGHPDESVKVVGPKRNRNDECDFAWQFEGAGEEAARGTGIAQVAPDGRLSWIHLWQGKRRRRLFAAVSQMAKDNTAPLIAILGGVLFGTLYIPLSLYYREFGVTPREAGLGDYSVVWSIVTVASLLVLVALLFLVVFLLGFFAPVTLLTRMTNRLQPGWPKPAIALLTSGVFLGPAALIFIGSVVSPVVGFPALGLLALLIGYFLMRRPEDARIHHQEVTRFLREMKRDLPGAFLGILLTIAVPAAGWFVWQATVDARQVRETGNVPSDLLPWRAEPVRVTWKIGSAPFEVADCGRMRLLGMTAERIVLFDWKLDRTYLVDPGDVVLQFPPCVGPETTS